MRAEGHIYSLLAKKLTTSCGATGVKRQDTNDTNDEDVKVANEDSPRLLVIKGCNVQRRSAIAFELCDISWAVKGLDTYTSH